MTERISRKELKKPDEFFNVVQQAIQWVFAHRRVLILGLLAVVLAVLASSAWKWYKLNQEKKASILFVDARKAVSGETKSNPSDKGAKNYDSALEKLTQIRKEYAATNTACVAAYFIGELNLKAEKYKQARDSFKSYLDEAGQNGEMVVYALEGIGISYENEGKPQQAVDYFRRMTEPPFDLEPDRGMYHLARLQEKEGKSVEAKDAYQQILSKHPNTIFIQEIQQRLASLESRADVSPKEAQPETKPTPQSEQSEKTPQKATEDRG